MAQTTLPATRPQPAPRKRVFFGLFDADGWSWASVKAIFWFVLMIMLLGLPARSRVLLHGPADRRPRPPRSGRRSTSARRPTTTCRAPCRSAPRCRGSRRRPRSSCRPVAPTASRPSSARRTCTPAAPTARRRSPDVYFAKAVGDGNLDGWKAAPPLPEARSAAAAAVIGTTMYVIGGYGPDGKPTDTTYSITVANDGSLGDWATVDVAKLPVPLAGLSAAAVSDGIVVMGGTDGTAPIDERVEDAADQHRARHAPGVGGPEPAGGAERRRRRVPRRRLRLPRRREQRQRPGRDGPGRHARRPRHGAGEPQPDELAVEVQRPDEPARPAHEPLGLHVQRDDLHPGRLRRHEPAGLHAVDDPRHQRRDPPVADAVADRPRTGRPGLGGDGRGLARVHRGRPRLGRPDRRRGPDEPRARRRRSSSWACWARPCRASSSTARSASRSAT